MKLMKNIKKVGSAALDFTGKHDHTIMAIGAGVGVVVSVVMAFKAAPKTEEIIEKKKTKIKEVNESEELTEEEKKKERKAITKETVKELAPVVAPVIISTMATEGLIAGSAVTAGRKIKNYAAIASMSELAYQELSDKTRKFLGDEKLNEIKGEIAGNKIEALYEDDPGLMEDGILQAKGGDKLYYDAINGRLFRSDDTTIRDVALLLNEKIAAGKEPYISLNEFYIEMELPQLPSSEEIGWGGYSLHSRIEMNLYNSIPLGKSSSARVMDFFTRPSRIK